MKMKCGVKFEDELSKSGYVITFRQRVERSPILQQYLSTCFRCFWFYWDIPDSYDGQFLNKCLLFIKMLFGNYFLFTTRTLPLGLHYDSILTEII